MIEDIKQMQARHKREIEKLQGLCQHNNHKRMPYMWAPGHFSNDVEVCGDCGKILDTYDTSTMADDDVSFSVTGN